MQILITGGNGFVGTHLKELLDNTEHEYFAPLSDQMNCLNKHEVGEVFSEFEPDAVVHLAATCGGIGINKDNPGRFIYENLQMGINVLDVSRIMMPKGRVVFLGTVCQYPKFTPVPFKEDFLWNGYPEETNAPYGIAKRACMEMGVAYNRQYGLEVVNFLPVNMAGEWDNFDLYSSHVIPALIRKFEEARGEPVTLWGTGSASREFLYAGDCVEAIYHAITTDGYPGPDPINLGTGREITIKDLAEKVKEVGGYSSDIEWDSTKPDGQPRRCLDTSRAVERLGWRAKTSMNEMLARVISWYKVERVKNV